MKKTLLVCFGLAVLAALPALAELPAFEGTVEQAVGSYAGGSLIQPDRMDSEGPGFIKIFVPRDRGYGTHDWLEVMRYATQELKARFSDSERLQIGDISARAGGKISGHASHQIGLDGDTSFYNHSHREQDPQSVSGFEVSYVVNNRVTSDFDLERNFVMARILAGTGRLNRIFVNAAIKKAFCDYAASLPDEADGPLGSVSDTLRRLRPWSGHDDHMHIRLTCPQASPRCVPQEAPPAGNGCQEVSNIKGFFDSFEKSQALIEGAEQHSEE